MHHMYKLYARVESVYTTPKIFGLEFETRQHSGMRLFIFTSVGTGCKGTCSSQHILVGVFRLPLLFF